jgi:UDP-N-acetylmuramate-alanine ligase
MSRSFYLIAIGGTAMTPLAALLVEKGERGPRLRPATLSADVRPARGPGNRVLPRFDARNVPPRVDRVVVGNLAGKDNPELVAALSRGLPVASMPETLRTEFLAGRHPVVVAGTHGKTTTTALTAWLLAAAGRSPGYLVAGEPRNFPSPSAIGTGEAFVVEGDEYSTSWEDKGPKFLHYAPGRSSSPRSSSTTPTSTRTSTP